MRRTALASAAILFTGLTSIAVVAAPAAPKSTVTGGNPSITLAQGWWEREHREERARESYWRLPPPALERYNQLQALINELQERRRVIDERINRAQWEQHRILGIAGR